MKPHRTSPRESVCLVVLLADLARSRGYPPLRYHVVVYVLLQLLLHDVRLFRVTLRNVFLLLSSVLRHVLDAWDCILTTRLRTDLEIVRMISAQSLYF